MGDGRFYIVDVFAERKYAGNQLAVFVDAGSMSDQQMQVIAREMHFSETTFVLSDRERDGGYDVRIFTPAAEVPFAGHPTLGTAHVIARALVGRPLGGVNLNLKVGQIPVTFERGGGSQETAWMRPKDAVFGEVVPAKQIAEVMTISVDDVDDRFPIQSVSTGIASWLVPLRSLDAVKRAGVLREQYLAWVEDKEAKGVLVFCPETYSEENDLNVRFFAEYYGIPEDPATGSANSCLAAYLVKHKYLGTEKVDVRVEQGYEIERPSLLYLQAERVGDRIDVRVGGKVVMVATGKLL